MRRAVTRASFEPTVVGFDTQRALAGLTGVFNEIPTDPIGDELSALCDAVTEWYADMLADVVAELCIRDTAASTVRPKQTLDELIAQSLNRASVALEQRRTECLIK